MPFRLRVLALLAAASAVLSPLPASASTPPPPGSLVRGGDVSWPNCPRSAVVGARHGLGLPMPTSDSRFVVLGLTFGPAFTANPCLAAQVRWARSRHLWTGAYAVVSYPTAAQLARYGGTGTLDQRLRRVGAAMAAADLRTLRATGLRVPRVWVDVEPVRGLPWSGRTASNRSLVLGALAGFRAGGVRVGLYSYAYGWRQITGGMQVPGVPTWVPAGAGWSQALARCSQRSFSGAPVWMGQFSDGTRDHDVTCPGVSGSRTRRSLFPVMFAST